MKFLFNRTGFVMFQLIPIMHHWLKKLYVPWIRNDPYPVLMMNPKWMFKSINQSSKRDDVEEEDDTKPSAI